MQPGLVAALEGAHAHLVRSVEVVGRAPPQRLDLGRERVVDVRAEAAAHELGLELLEIAAKLVPAHLGELSHVLRPRVPDRRAPLESQLELAARRRHRARPRGQDERAQIVVRGLVGAPTGILKPGRVGGLEHVARPHAVQVEDPCQREPVKLPFDRPIERRARRARRAPRRLQLERQGLEVAEAGAMNQAERRVLLLVLLDVVGVERGQLADVVDAADVAGLDALRRPQLLVERVPPAALHAFEEAPVLQVPQLLRRPGVDRPLEHVRHRVVAPQLVPVDRAMIERERRLRGRALRHCRVSGRMDGSGWRLGLTTCSRGRAGPACAATRPSSSC